MLYIISSSVPFVSYPKSRVLESRRIEGDISRHIFSIPLARRAGQTATALRHYRLKNRAPGAVAGFAVVQADAEIGRLAGRTYRKVDDVGLAVGIYHVGEFQRIGGGFGQSPFRQGCPRGEGAGPSVTVC